MLRPTEEVDGKVILVGHGYGGPLGVAARHRRELQS